jgi:hypothetical protein
MAGKCLLAGTLLWITGVSLHAKSPVSRVEISPRTTVAKAEKGTPHEINYQGWLGDKGDTAGVTGDLDMTFRLYDARTAGSVLWNETQNAVTVDKGIFNVLLGSGTPIPSSIFTGGPLWLETQVESDTLSPRKKLVSVGYAMKSENADNAIYADTAGYALTADIGVVDSANVATNAWKWNTSLWGTEYPKANIADSANYVAGANVDGEVAQANKADTAAYALATGGVADTANYAKDSDKLDGQHASAFALVGHAHTHVDSATYADTANYARDSDKVDGYDGSDLLGPRSIDGVSNDGGDIDLIAGGSIAITPDDLANTIIISSTTDSVAYADTAGYASSSAPDSDWTVSGNDMYSSVSGNVGIGTTSPSTTARLRVEANGKEYGIHARGSNGKQAGVYGHANGATYGVYGRGSGGQIAGVFAWANDADFGLLGMGDTGKEAGVWGWANGATYGVYSEGDMACSGAKPAVVRTSEGPTEMYCVEATELWFEDFGTGRLTNGQAQIDLARDFLETVTIDADNPMKVFIQLADDCNGVYVKKGLTSFEIIELGSGTSNASFDYRIVAKRKHYETRRMKVVESCYTDKLLYPDDNDPAIPPKWREARQKRSEVEIRAKEAATK